MLSEFFPHLEILGALFGFTVHISPITFFVEGYQELIRVWRMSRFKNVKTSYTSLWDAFLEFSQLAL